MGLEMRVIKRTSSSVLMTFVCSMLPEAVVSYVTAPTPAALKEDCAYKYPFTERCIDFNETSRDFSSSSICESLKHEVLDRNTGLVEFSLLLPQDIENEYIFLKTRETLTNNHETNCSSNVDVIHSKFFLYNPGSTTCSQHQLKEVKWKSNYLFSGCYVVEVGEMRLACPVFYVESDFQKVLIVAQNVTFIPKVVNNRVTLTITSYLLKNDCNNPTISTSCIEIHLYLLSNFTTFTTKVEVYKQVKPFQGTHTRHCYWVEGYQGVVDLWWNDQYDTPSLEVTFEDLPSGRYGVQLCPKDTRCDKNTLWTDTWPDSLSPCKFESEILVEAVLNESMVAVNLLYQRQASTSWEVAVIVVVSSVLIGIFIFIGLIGRDKPKSSSPMSFPAPVTVPLEPLEGFVGPSKVLLLYAKDCQPVMDALSQLRNLIALTTGAEVFDIWDLKRWDDIDLVGDTWALQYLHSEYTKVVVVVTPTSRKIEEWILTGLEVAYVEPDYRDAIYVAAFKTSIGMTSTCQDRCQKFIVVRLNSEGISKHELTTFKPLCTIYTLPQHLDDLMARLSDGHKGLYCREALPALQVKIEEYSKFIAANPDYLDRILCSPNDDGTLT